MTIVIDEDDFIVLLADFDMQELVENRQLVCLYQGGKVVMNVTKGMPSSIQYEVTDKLITLGIDYELRV